MYSSTLAVAACIFSTNFAQIEAGVKDVADMLNSVVVVCLLSTNLVQVDAGVGDVLRESMLVNEKNPKKNLRTEIDLQDMAMSGMAVLEEKGENEAGEKKKKEGTKKNKTASNSTKSPDGIERNGALKKGNLTMKAKIAIRGKEDTNLLERLAKGDSKSKELAKEKGEYKEKETDKREYKEEEIDADLWDKLVKEQASKRNKSAIVEEALERASEDKREEEDRKAVENVALLTETDWAEAVNFLQKEQFSSRQDFTFTSKLLSLLLSNNFRFHFLLTFSRGSNSLKGLTFTF